ncbi:MAG: YlbF family regulator [Planctomycetaceae bacterium]|nr:YlbF family regulator [Planctomycetales bacterium]MCB9921844.1 YlbF family regulator [Planctomycetaceae bacterium]
MVDDSEKPANEPTNSPTDPVASANTSLPTVEQWKEAGATTLGLAQRTLVAFWAHLRPILEKLLSQIETVFTKRASVDEPVSSERVPLVEESKKPAKPTTAPFPTVDQWAETGETIVDLTKRTAYAVFNNPANNQNPKRGNSPQVVDAREGKPSESKAEPDVSFATLQTSETETRSQAADGKIYCPICRERTKHTPNNDLLIASIILTVFTCGLAFPLIILAAMVGPQPPLCRKCVNSGDFRGADVNLKKDELCVVNWGLSDEIRLPTAISTPGGSKVKCLNVWVNVYFRVKDGEPRVTRLTLGESSIAGLVSFTVAASRTGEGWTADASLKRYLERSILPTITEDDLKQDENLVRAMWSKYRSSLPDEPAPDPNDAPPFESPTQKQSAFAKKLGVEVSPSMSKVDVAFAIEDAIESNPTLKKKLEEREAKRQQQEEEAERLQRIKECGPELLAAEAKWQKFVDEIGFMLAVYQRGTKTIVDVLEVYDVSIEGKRKKKLKLYAAAPNAEKLRVEGMLWDEEHVLLFWSREIVLPLEKLLYHEPLRAKFDECSPSEYARTVRRGLQIAERL